MSKINIAIFASGSGSNAENIALYFKDNPDIHVRLILSNKEDAYVLERAKKLSIDHLSFNREQFVHSNEVIRILKDHAIDFIILAGFLWLVPKNLIEAFPDKIVNIHPALLPNYGGKGMYGDKVHQAVFDNNEKESGITIHYVNENYDEGNIIFQEKCELTEKDTPKSIAQKVHELEYNHFPRVIEEVISKSF